MLLTLIRRATVSVVLATGMFVSAALPALAHADLVSAEQVVTGSQHPASLQLTFSEGIELAFTKVTMTDAVGGEVELGEPALDASDNRIVVLGLTGLLSAGAYTIEWSVVSTDGHKMEGTTPFEAAP